jgi:hypothetical protein
VLTELTWHDPDARPPSAVGGEGTTRRRSLDEAKRVAKDLVSS